MTPAGWFCMKDGCTFMSERMTMEAPYHPALRSEAARAPIPRAAAPIVPKSTIAGRALVAVVAIMTFLASLTTGSVMLVRSSANEWQADVAREVTIQIRPASGRDIEADVRAATALARAFPGIGDVRAYSKEESGHLLEPWLGAGLSLDELPLPRLIVVRIDGRPDLEQLRRQLAERLPGASLDDHRAWIERMRTMARTAVVGGLLILLLVLVATMLSVTFATTGAMATNRPIIEVLHFVGAKDTFIASHFLRHFLVLGLKGGALGGGMAVLVFATVQFATGWLTGSASGDQLTALFGSFSLGVLGYAAVLAQIFVIAAVTALASRRTVNRTLASIQ
jgi:cell division transport system permease protein